MEITTGKRIDSSMLKRRYEKLKACAEIRDLCKQLSRGFVDCPICGGERKEHLVEIYGFSYVTCLGCRLVYICNPPSPEEIQSLYSSDFYTQFEKSLYGDHQVSEYRLQNVATPKVQYVEERLGRKGAWLDIGCGTGEVLAAAQSKGWRVHGIETNLDAAKFGRERFGVPITTDFITETGVGQLISEFDVISMFGVLEHLYKPCQVVEVISERMRKDAVLVIEVPHYPSISCFSQIAFPEFVDRIMTPPMHLMIFSMEAMVELLQRQGLGVTHAWFFGQDFYEWLTTLMNVCRRTTTAEKEAKDIWHHLGAMISEFQEVIDSRCLSDEMLVIARRG